MNITLEYLSQATSGILEWATRTINVDSVDDVNWVWYLRAASAVDVALVEKVVSLTDASRALSMENEGLQNQVSDPVGFEYQLIADVLYDRCWHWRSDWRGWNSR